MNFLCKNLNLYFNEFILKIPKLRNTFANDVVFKIALVCTICVLYVLGMYYVDRICIWEKLILNTKYFRKSKNCSISHNTSAKTDFFKSDL